VILTSIYVDLAIEVIEDAEAEDDVAMIDERLSAELEQGVGAIPVSMKIN
jgi:hypothetical protein